MKNEKINSFALSTIIPSYTGASFYGIYSSYILNKSNTSTILAMILGYLLSLILSIFIIKLFSNNPSSNFNDKLKKAYGKFSIIMNILFTICSLLVYIFFTYRFVVFLSTQYLVETSKIQILLLILVTTYYIASHGIETVSRVSTISFYFIAVIFLFNFISLFKEIDFNNLLPIINAKPQNIIETIITFSFYFTSPLIYINVIKKDDLIDKENFNKWFLIMQFISFISIFIAMSFTIGTFGINVAMLFDYPLYSVLKKIQLFSFLDSIENIRVILWLLSSINASSITLLFIFNNLKNMFNLSYKTSKKINIIILFISFLIPCFLFLKNNFLESFQYILIPLIISITLFLINTITLFLTKIKEH